MSYVTCPHCDHEFTSDDMCSAAEDLWAIAPDEGETECTCPSCDKEFFVRGSYIPVWTSYKTEDDLL
jgi:uncharacterized C2H2 Zn-finger protein